jgi:hypothetical protein
MDTSLLVMAPVGVMVAMVAMVAMAAAAAAAVMIPKTITVVDKEAVVEAVVITVMAMGMAATVVVEADIREGAADLLVHHSDLVIGCGKLMTSS